MDNKLKGIMPALMTAFDSESGGISTTYNYMSELFLLIYELFSQGRIKEANAVQSLANQVIAEVISKGTLSASKQMITFSGLDYGVCREPLLPLDEEEKKELYEKAWKPIENYTHR